MAEIEDIHERADRLTRLIDEQFRPHREEITQRLTAIHNGKESLKIRFAKLQAIMSEVRAYAAPYIACRRGCSACCYQRVLLSQTEANAIGAMINWTPKMLPRNWKALNERKFGPATPCSFLKDGECSIYGQRPLMCRNFVNLDITPASCSFENWQRFKEGESSIGIPMLSFPPPVHVTYNFLSGKGTDVFADIRDFFPPPRP